MSKANLYFARARWCWIEDLRLHLTGQGGIDRQNDQLRYFWTQGFHAFEENLTGRVDLFLTGKKDQNIT